MKTTTMLLDAQSRVSTGGAPDAWRRFWISRERRLACRVEARPGEEILRYNASGYATYAARGSVGLRVYERRRAAWRAGV